MFAPVDHDAGQACQLFLAHGLADHRKCLLRDFVLRNEIKGFVEKYAVHIRHRDEFLDFDGMRAFQRNVVELVFLDQHVLAFFELGSP